ncbi:MAG: LptA/OstA family protein [Planctomycetota bacterium]
MRFLVVFLLAFIPLAAAIYLLSEEAPKTQELPDRAPPADRPGVLSGSEVADEHGSPAFPGKIDKAEGLELDLYSDDGSYVRFHIEVERLARHEGRPRSEGILVAAFQPPKEGEERPNLLLTIKAPHAVADLSRALRAAKDTPAIVTLGGRVVVHDSSGRLLADLDGLDIDVTNETISSPEPVRMRAPKQELEVRATGLFANVGLKEVLLKKEVTLTTPRVRLGCKGPATLKEEKKDEEYRVVLNRGAWVEHRILRATCQRIEALLVQTGNAASGDLTGKDLKLQRATLDGGVVVGLDSSLSRGLEKLEVPRLEIESESRLILHGPVRAVRRGPLHLLGLGERTMDLIAGSGEIRVRAVEGKEEVELEELRFADTVEMKDREGPGRLRAGTLFWSQIEEVLFARGAVEVETTDGLLMAESLRLEGAEKEKFELLLEGKKRIEQVADGKLDPLGDGLRGKLVITSKGPLRFSRNGKEIRFLAREKVTVRLAQDSLLECDELFILLKDRELVSMSAAGSVRVVDGVRKAEVSGDRFTVEGKRAVVEGTPARVFSPEHGLILASTIAYTDGGAFDARGAVRVEARLGSAGSAGRWVILCGRATGVMEKDKPPSSLKISEGLVADGPEGQHVEGRSLDYDGKTGKALLLGEPAVVRRGEGLSMEGPGFDLTVRDRGLAGARTRGKATVEFRSEEAGSLKRWRIRLRGPADFLDEGRIVVEAGAEMEGYDEQGRLAVEGYANRAVVELKRTKEAGWQPARILGSKGVRMQGHGKREITTTAQGMSYAVGEKLVHIHGGARVQGGGWSPELSFERLVFVLTKDGVDLKRASKVEIVEDANR